MIRKLMVLVSTTLAFTATAHAKDWIEKVDIVNDGIDLVPIEVKAGGNGYSSIKTNKHRFNLRLYARAKKGKRIAGGVVGSGDPRFLEASGGEWQRLLAFRDIGSGKRRELKLSKSYNIPVSKLVWVGSDPVEKCNQVLANKVQQGKSKASLLKSGLSTSAKVLFKFDAAAARPKVAEKNKVKIGNHTSERKGMNYSVVVKCLAKPGRATSG